jgi:hypothetical protein
MGIWDPILKLFRKKSVEESITQSQLNQKSITEESFKNQSINQESESLTSTIHPESLQLGIAAGFTGRTLRDIESSLERIESMMISKDWFKSEFQTMFIQNLQSIKQLIETHDEKEQKRFENILENLGTLREKAKLAPEPLKKEILTEIEKIEVQLPLQPRMMRVITAIKEAGEITYEDLATKLNISQDCLRGLISIICKKDPNLKRIRKLPSKKIWLKYSTNQSPITQNQSGSTESLKINQEINPSLTNQSEKIENSNNNQNQKSI